MSVDRQAEARDINTGAAVTSEDPDRAPRRGRIVFDIEQAEAALREFLVLTPYGRHVRHVLAHPVTRNDATDDSDEREVLARIARLVERERSRPVGPPTEVDPAPAER